MDRLFKHYTLGIAVEHQHISVAVVQTPWLRWSCRTRQNSAALVKFVGRYAAGDDSPLSLPLHVLQQYGRRLVNLCVPFLPIVSGNYAVPADFSDDDVQNLITQRLTADNDGAGPWYLDYHRQACAEDPETDDLCTLAVEQAHIKPALMLLVEWQLQPAVLEPEYLALARWLKWALDDALPSALLCIHISEAMFTVLVLVDGSVTHVKHSPYTSPAQQQSLIEHGQTQDKISVMPHLTALPDVPVASLAHQLRRCLQLLEISTGLDRKTPFVVAGAAACREPVANILMATGRQSIELRYADSALALGLALRRGDRGGGYAPTQC